VTRRKPSQISTGRLQLLRLFSTTHHSAHDALNERYRLWVLKKGCSEALFGAV
jgi:hypothetical protein